MRPFLAVVLMGALSGSCKYGVADINGVPPDPTYNKDIYPLLRDHCILCHGAKPSRGAPSDFRLDVYDSNSDFTVLGAKDMASSVLGAVKDGSMPPAAKDGDGVGPNGLEMLGIWANTTPEPPR